MGEHLSPDQILQKYKSGMPAHVGDRFNGLFHSVAWLHSKWFDYRSLYAESEATITLLNAISGTLFHDIERLHWESLILHLCRLTDRNTNTLSLKSIEKLIPSTEPESFRSEVRKLIETSNTATDFAKHCRNNFIAHAVVPKSPGRVAAKHFDADVDAFPKAMRAIADTMNCIEKHYMGSEVAYNTDLGASLGVQSLLGFLQKGLDAQRAKDAARFGRAE